LSKHLKENGHHFVRKDHIFVQVTKQRRILNQHGTKLPDLQFDQHLCPEEQNVDTNRGLSNEHADKLKVLTSPN
jgi:hypothetical protein